METTMKDHHFHSPLVHGGASSPLLGFCTSRTWKMVLPWENMEKTFGNRGIMVVNSG